MRWMIVALMGLAVACSSSEKDGKGTSGASSAAPAAHAEEGAKPGSHEDWCGEHAVPESQCTRCNKGLIPAFQATGDWCSQHAVPESQCLKCNPDLKIVRPPKGS